MDVHYFQDKDIELKMVAWRMAEDMQDANPHFLVGWWGFIFFLIDPCILGKDLTTKYTDGG